MNIVKVYKIKDKYNVYIDENLIAEFTLAKFTRAYEYAVGNPLYKTPISLNASLESGFNMFGVPLNWDELREHIINPDDPVDEEEEVEELPPVPEWGDIIKHLPDYRRYAFETIMSFMGSNKTIENPPWLAIVAPPSTGKSFMLKLFDHPSVSLLIDDFTENALSAGRPNRDAAEVSSMLDDARGKNLVLNDMSSVFSQRPEKVNKFIGSLTTAYGGTFVKYSPGSGAQRHNSETTLIMGMTNKTFKKHRQYMGMLGNRFLFLTLKRPKHIRHREDKRTFDVDELRRNVCAFQQHIISLEDPELLEEVDDYLYDFVHKVILIRNIRWIRTYHEMEGEDRLYQEMIELCKTRAKIHGRKLVSKEDVDFFKPIAYETIPYIKNIKQIYGGIDIHCNNKWTKGMLLNAINMGLTKVVEEENVTVTRGFHEVKEVRRIFTWNDEIMDFLDNLNVLYEDDGDNE